MLMQRRNLPGPGIDTEEVVKNGPLLTAEISAPGRRFRPRHGLQGLHGGQNHEAANVMIAQIGRRRNGQGNRYRFYGLGKVFHKCTVLGSTATGIPLAFRAQCCVNPRQTSAPVSAWVMI